MRFLKMPVEEPKRAAVTPLKRGGPYEVLPLPQDGCKDAATSSQLPLPQQLAVWRRDAFWQREPKSQNNPSLRTGPEESIRVMMQVPKLRHEQRPEVPELTQTLP